MTPYEIVVPQEKKDRVLLRESLTPQHVNSTIFLSNSILLLSEVMLARGITNLSVFLTLSNYERFGRTKDENLADLCLRFIVIAFESGCL